MHLDHINISASWTQLTQLKDFYCNILELVVGSRPEFSRRGFWLYSGDQALLHLTESYLHGPGERRHHLDHYALRGQGLPAFIERLTQRRVAYQIHYLEALGQTQVFFDDPIGNGVEVNFMEVLQV